MTRQEVTQRVKQSVISIDPDAKIILFGSRARGDYKTNSDWDFLILASKQINETFKKKIREALIDTELEAEEVISTLIYSQKTWSEYKYTPLYKNITNEGFEL